MTPSLFEILQQRRGRVLFASGSSTRNQTAEAFARSLGSDVMETASVGDALALQSVNPADFDVIVNMSACALPDTETLVLSVPLPDRGGEAARIETFVAFLAEHFRRAKEWRSGVERASATDEPQTNPIPPPAERPPQDAATHAAF